MFRPYLTFFLLLFVVFSWTESAFAAKTYTTVEECRADGGQQKVGCLPDEIILGDICVGGGVCQYKCCTTQDTLDLLACIQAGGDHMSQQCGAGLEVSRINGRGCCKKAPPSTAPPTSASLTYTPLEAIPGQGTTQSDFPAYVKALYAFAIFSVAIAALLMVMIGGFIYVTAAGNTSQVDKGKEFIKDALIGIVVAFGSYLILYVINPNLVNINLDSLRKLTMTSGGATWGPVGQHPIRPIGNGTCDTVPSGACSVDSLKNTCFGSNAEAFSRLCNKESRGTPVQSGTDRCDNYGGVSFSGGLFQINVLTHADLFSDPRCANLGDKGSCAPGKRRGDGICLGWNCELSAGKTVADINYCMGLTMNKDTNFKAACFLSRNGVSMQPWRNSATKCGLGGY